MTDALEESERLEQAEVLRRKQQEEARKLKLVARAKFSMTEVSPFDVFNISPVKPRGWDTGRVLTEKQRSVLLKQGVDPSALPYAQSKQLLDEIFRRFKSGQCGLKLARTLHQKGMATNVSAAEAVKSIRSGRPPMRWQKHDEEGVVWELLPATK